MDTVLLVGNAEERLPKLLEKLGYRVLEDTGSGPLSEIIEQELLDLVLVDSRCAGNVPDLCEFVRTFETTRDVPVIVIAFDPDIQPALEELAFPKLEICDGPISVGRLATKIATNLRLRKTAGKDAFKASLAEKNAMLRDLNAHFQRELEEARAIHASLLPDALPKNPAVDMAVWYQPLEGVGGDWYYVDETDSGQILVQVADVTGHGLSAAFICSMTKLAYMGAGRAQPGELLGEMNRLMAPVMPEGRFVTACSYLFDPKDGAVIFGRAGHLPGLLIRNATGEVEELLGDGFAVGFFDLADYTEVTSSMDVGDTLVVMTDGITEAQNRDFTMYESERLVEIVKKSPPEVSAEEILAAVKEDFDLFRDGRILKDDVTLLILRRRAAEG